MSETVEIEVLWLDSLTFTGTGPGFVITDGALANRITAIARWPIRVATATLSQCQQ